MKGAYATSVPPCPACGGECTAEFVDIGVGMQQVEPAHCYSCGWVESCPYTDNCVKGKCTAWHYCRGGIHNETGCK